MKKTKLVTMLLALSLSAMLGSGCQLFDKGESSSPDSVTSEQPGSELPESSSGTDETDVTVALDKTAESVDLFSSLTLKATVTGSTASVAWTSSAPTVATVSSKGVVTPLAIGTAEITATVEGVSAKCTVTVTAPTEAIEIVVPYASLNLETGDTQKLSPVGYLDVKELSDGVYTYSSTDETVATVAADGTITAVKAGNVTIKINGTFKGIAATELSLAVSVADPLTHDSETIAANISYYANRQDTLSIDLSAYNFTEIQSFAIDEQEYAFTMEEKVLNVAKTALAGIRGGDKEILISGLTATGDITISAKMLYVDYAIGSVAEWNAFGEACNLDGATQTPYLYVILTDNIDYQGGFFTEYYETGAFNGYFDGQGFTVSNITVKYSIFYTVQGTETTPAVIKNVGFVNVEKTTANGGGLLANTFGNAEVSNVYVKGKISAYTGGGSGAFCNNAIGMTNTVKNSVFVVDMASNPGNIPALMGSGNVYTKIENVYAISNNSSGKLVGNDAGTVMNSTLYTSVGDFKAEVTALPSGFETSLWEMKDGMLVFKSALQYATTPSVELTVNATGTDAIAGSPLTFTVDNASAVIAIEGENTEGITISGNAVTIAESVPNGTTFKIVARVYDLISGAEAKDESVEFTVVQVENVELEGKQTVAKNRNETLTFDLSEASITELTAVTFGTTPIDLANVTFDNGIVEIAVSALPGGLDMNVSIAAKKAEGYVTATATVSVYDYAIGTVAELNTFGSELVSKYATGQNGATLANGNVYKTPYLYVVLTADIKYGNANFSTYYSGISPYFYGTFDGQGHTISNIQANYSLFVGAWGTDANKAVIKNVAFTNLQKMGSSVGGLLFYYAQNVLVDNVYIEGKIMSTGAGANCSGLLDTALASKGVEIKNTLVNVDFVANSGKSHAVVSNGTATLTNVYAISANSSGYMQKDVTEGLYTTHEAFKTEVTAVPEGFNADLWEMKDGMLVFKSALNYAVNAVEIALEGEATEIIRGASMSFTATAGATINAVGENVEGITISGNTVAVASAVAGGTTFKLRATYFDTITGKTLTAESRELTVVTSEEVTLEGVRTAAKNRNEKLTLDLSAYSITELTSVTIGTAAIDLANVTFDNGVLEIAASALPGGLDMNVSIAAKKADGYLTATATVSVYDYAIGTVAELNAFGSELVSKYATGQNGATLANGSVYKTPYLYVVLTADIEYGNANFSTYYSGISPYFYGTFDGQGHTISNIQANYSLFVGAWGTDGNKAVIKNVAFTNLQKMGSSVGGLLFYYAQNVLVDNVYIEGKIMSTGAGANCSGLLDTALASKGVEIKNTLVNVDFVANSGKSHAIVSNGTATLTNVYAISANSSGYMQKDVTEGLYTTHEAFKAAVIAVPEGFNTEYWEMRAGMLVFKSALTYAVTEISVAFNDEKTELVAGSSIGFTASAGVSLSISGENTEGITINGNQVNVASTVAGGTKFKLVATYFDTITGQTLTAESAEMTVVNEARLETMDGEQTVAKNRNGNLELDLSAYSITELTAVKIGDAAVTAYTFEAGKLTVASADITANGHLNIAIEAKTATGDLMVSAKAYVVDYAIGTADELSAFGKDIVSKYANGANGGALAYTGVYRTKYLYVILTDDIDYGGENFANSYSGVGVYFCGTFDGQGHTISNIQATYSLIVGAWGVSETEQTVFKNVAITNLQKTGSSVGGLLFYYAQNVLVDNVYIEGKVTSASAGANCSGLLDNSRGGVTIQNTVVKVDFVANSGKSHAVVANNTATITNVYAITANSTGSMQTGVTNGLYTTDEAFKTAVTALPEGFNSEYWVMQDGMLTFKSTIAEASEEA